jgi:subtilisin family serine protease
MPGHGIRALLCGAAGRLPREVARFLNSQDWLFGDSAEEKPRVFKRRLRIEPLESRHLMDAGGASSLVDPLWFQSVASDDTAAHAGAANWTIESVASSSSAKASAAVDSGVNDWIIQFNTASLTGIHSVAETAGLLAGGGIDFQIIEGLGLNGLVLVRSSGASIETVEGWLDTDVNVATFERDALDQVDAVPSDPQYSQLWGMDAIDASDAWNISTGSSSVVVAVLDTGVDYTHRDLAANIWTNPGEIAGNGIDDDGNGFVDDVHGYDFVNNDGNPMDDNSHGTHVAGTIAAVANNGTGVAGVNWSSSIMALKFLDANGSGYLSDAIRAINYATMMRTKYGVNVRVMNNSWGGDEYSAALDSAIRASGAADILFVAAAGNDATNNDSIPQYPANCAASNVISVAAVDQSDHLASFSCYGATTVDIGAPGVSIYSTIPGNRYAIFSGTSMATPFVSGVAALAWAVDPKATVAEVRSAILSGADHVAALSGKVASGGVLNAHTTLTLLDSGTSQQDDHGGSAATASTVAVPSATAGTIEVNGDVDWFAFQAVAGKSYVLSVQLGTLDDSVLYLYDTKGASQLACNDDYSSGTGSQITWTAPSSGVYYVAVGSYGNTGTGTYTLNVQTQSSTPQNVAPVLAAVGSQTLAYPDTTLAVPLSASDANGDSLTYSARVMTIDSLAQKAYALDQQLGLHTFAGGNYYTNVRGAGEKYLLGNGGTMYFILSNGSLYRWGGSIAKSTLIDTLSPAYYADPALLQAAQAPSLVSISSSDVTASVVGNRLTVTRASDFNGVLCVRVTVSDGQRSDSEVFTIADPLAQKAYDLDQQLGLHTYSDGNYYTNARGAGEKYMIGNDNVLYFIRPNGALYRWGGSIAKSAFVASLSSAYYATPTLLHDAPSPTLVASLATAAACAVEGTSDSTLTAVGGTEEGSDVPATNADAAANVSSVALAWLASEDAGRLGTGTSDVVASAVTTSVAADASGASLHDRAICQLLSANSQTPPDDPLAALDQLLRRGMARNRADLRAGSAGHGISDSVFGVTVETLLPLATPLK